MGRQRPAIGPARFRAGGGNWRVAYIPRCRVEYILWSRRPIGRGPASMDRKGRTILAKNLKALRDLHAMTQEDLAGAAQIDRSYISMIENVKFAASVDMIEKIAAAFQLDIDEMLQADIVESARVRLGQKSEERRVGKEGVSTFRSRWAPDH